MKRLFWALPILLLGISASALADSITIGLSPNNGSGDTEMRKHMYPHAPDMRQEGTQNLTDGVLFYIIQNGIRLSGMPSWGSRKSRDEGDSWKLVRLIRHLPNLTIEEEREILRS